MQVKICGIKTPETARFAIEAGADLLGFVFADSKRRISVETAKKLREQLPEGAKAAGVFVDEDLETVNRIADEVGLDYVQLHGSETPDYCREVKAPVIKAFQITSVEDFKEIEQYPCDYFLLDSPGGKYRGGSGEAFDWKLIRHAPELSGKVILAGGLHPDNIGEAIREVKPAGVDVSSGVETDGEKDHDKIKAFIDAAKTTKVR